MEHVCNKYVFLGAILEENLEAISGHQLYWTNLEDRQSRKSISSQFKYLRLVLLFPDYEFSRLFLWEVGYSNENQFNPNNYGQSL